MEAARFFETLVSTYQTTWCHVAKDRNLQATLQMKHHQSLFYKLHFITEFKKHPLPAKVALTSPRSGGLSVGMVRLLTTATEFRFFIFFTFKYLFKT
jgi:hypothetical protein